MVAARARELHHEPRAGPASFFPHGDSRSAQTPCRLRPENFPERVALEKLVEELLDRIIGTAFTMGDLRDAVSRNQLKLPDLGGFGESCAATI